MEVLSVDLVRASDPLTKRDDFPVVVDTTFDAKTFDHALLVQADSGSSHALQLSIIGLLSSVQHGHCQTSLIRENNLRMCHNFIGVVVCQIDKII